jgi:hypothetical protein
LAQVEVPALVHTARDNAAPACETAKKYAVTISGQIQRFIWKDQRDPLIAPADVACPPVVDVFIAVHNGTMRRPWNRVITGVPYTTTTDEVVVRYKQRGARSVHVKWISDSDQKNMHATVEGTFDAGQKALVDRHRARRVDSNMNMMWLRHVAFTMALEHGTYDGYTYWREDNLFFTPLKESVFPTPDGARMVVDSYCGWGSYSDKIYVANTGGANLLFDRSFEEFKQKMQRWVQWASHRGGDRFQSEAFLQHVLTLGSATVTKVDLMRADVRYARGRLCLAGGYAHCSPTRLGNPISKC